MPAVGKEIERPLTSGETTQPLEQMGYVEKVEKQTETQQKVNSSSPQVVKPALTTDMGKIVSAQFAVQTKPKIVLPLDQEGVVDGLHRGVWQSIRWLSEWCVMMIKKYPGRVFYLPPETR
jgi:hypothetical protein